MAIEWQKGEPPKDDKRYLTKTKTGIICSSSYREGRTGEPVKHYLGWRCDCCGRFGTPEYWANIDA